MAFRASGSTPLKAKKTSDAIPEGKPHTEGSFSVEDLVGQPVGSGDRVVRGEEPSVLAEVIAPSVAPAIAPSIAPVAPPVSERYTNSSPSPRRFDHQGGAMGRHRDYGNRHYMRPRYSGNDASSGGAPSAPVPFTQDIDVPTQTVKGLLDIMPEGHGFLRPKFTPGDRDIYISQSQIRRFLLRNGDMVEGQARPPKENERYWGLLKVESVDDLPADQMEKRPKFEDLVPVYPNLHLKLETADPSAGRASPEATPAARGPLSTRMIDLLAPIGFGQRGLIVSPPKAGKTTILKEIAAGVAANYPDVHLMAALIGERPEEVTDISRNVKGEVLASNFDESPSEQTRIAEVALERAKRLVEMGRDVVILLDSITRLARAYNLVVNPSGRTLSGGFDPAALYPAKRFLGAARCVEPSSEAVALALAAVVPIKRYTSGGSLTVIGTALVDTGSRMDDLIYEEFKGTGNMELHLSRSLQERRVFPSIDAVRSGTRHDELLLGEDLMKKVSTLRHMLSLLSEEERTMMLIERLGKTKTNLEFLESLTHG